MPARYEFLPEMLPLIVMINHDSLHEEDIPHVFGYFRELARRRVRFVSVTDARHLGPIPDARMRKLLAEASRETNAATNAWTLGSAVVLNSSLLRGALTAMQWMSPADRPIVYFGTMTEAVDWAIGAIENADLEVTPEIREYRRQLR